MLDNIAANDDGGGRALTLLNWSGRVEHMFYNKHSISKSIDDGFGTFKASQSGALAQTQPESIFKKYMLCTNKQEEDEAKWENKEALNDWLTGWRLVV